MSLVRSSLALAACIAAFTAVAACDNQPKPGAHEVKGNTSTASAGGDLTAAKAVYPLPVAVNAWLRAEGGIIPDHLWRPALSERGRPTLLLVADESPHHVPDPPRHRQDCQSGPAGTS